MGQTISTTQFFVYGKRHFTQTGYLKHVKSYYNTEPQLKAALKPGEEGVNDDVDLTGKVVVITGANSGVGKEVSKYVVAKGATLYMMCRSAERAATARTEILAAAGLNDDDKSSQERVKVLAVDVAELDQVRKVAKELQTAMPEGTGIDCLVCNAGVLLKEQHNSSQGIESTFASHLLGGTYLLTTLLMPQLQATPGSRVVVVSSGGMYNTGLPSWDVMTSYTSIAAAESATAKTPEPPKSFSFDGTMAYAYAKRGQVVLMEEWTKQQQQTAESQTLPCPAFVTAHPGWTDTPAVDEAYGDQKKWLAPMRDPWQGAEGIAWLTAVDRIELESGAFYLDRKVQKKHIAGPFMTEGSFTKNTEAEIQEFMANLKHAAGAKAFHKRFCLMTR